MVCRYVHLGRTRYLLALRAIDIFLTAFEIRYVAMQLDIKHLRCVDMFAFGKLDINTFGMSICCFATRYMVALRPFDIFLATLEIRYVAYGNECRLRLFLHAPQGISSALAPYRVADISSGASAAHIDVESSCQRHDRFDMPRHREQIHRRHLSNFISQRAQECAVACERFGIAGDVDNTRGRKSAVWAGGKRSLKTMEVLSGEGELFLLKVAHLATSPSSFIYCRN